MAPLTYPYCIVVMSFPMVITCIHTPKITPKRPPTRIDGIGGILKAIRTRMEIGATSSREVRLNCS